MSRNRIRSIFMAVIMLLTTAVYAAPEDEETSGAVTAVPEVTVVCSNVDYAGKYLEIGLELTAQEFQTAGVVLSYDRDILQLIEWGKQEPDTVIPVTGNWTTVVPTKGADDISGKPGLATLPSARQTSGEDSSPGEDSGRAYLYLGADRLQFAQNMTDCRVVTARFAVKNAEALKLLTESSPAADLTSEDYTVCLATDEDILKTSKPGASVLVTAKKTETELNKYTYGTVISADKGLNCKVTFKTGKDSVNTGDSSTTVKGGAYSITFFDWDGRVIDAISASEEVTEGQRTLIETIEARLKTGGDLAKAGYEFDQWLAVYQANDGSGLQTVGGTFTSNDTALDTATNRDYVDFNTEKLSALTMEAMAATVNVADGANNAVSATENSMSVLVQAAYRATADINTGLTDETARHYTVTPIAYTRYGGATQDDGKYSITLQVERKNPAGAGVTRAKDPGVIVKMQPTAGGNPVYTLLSLENTDVVTCEVVPNKQIASVEYYFVDVATAPRGNWPGAGNRSPLKVSISQSGESGFIRLGTIGFINQMAREMTETDFAQAVDHQTFVDAGLSYSGPGMAVAQTRMYNAIRVSSGDLGKKALQDAINGS